MKVNGEGIYGTRPFIHFNGLPAWYPDDSFTKIDKVTVWDSMSNGTPNTANFLSGMMKSVPPMNEMFKMAGMDLPKFLGTETEDKPPLMPTESNE